MSHISGVRPSPPESVVGRIIIGDTVFRRRLWRRRRQEGIDTPAGVCAYVRGCYGACASVTIPFVVDPFVVSSDHTECTVPESTVMVVPLSPAFAMNPVTGTSEQTATVSLNANNNVELRTRELLLVQQHRLPSSRPRTRVSHNRRGRRCHKR